MFRDLRPYVDYHRPVATWEVPRHWAVRRLRYVLREVDVRSTDGAGQALSMSQRHGLVPAGQVARSIAPGSAVGSKTCAPGDIVLNRLKAHLGVFAVSPQAGLVSPDYTVLHLTGVDVSEYFATMLRSLALRQELRTRVRGIVEGFWRLYSDDLYDIRVPVPPPAEQAAIVKYLGHAHARIDRAIGAKRKLIALLEEQKQAVIDQAVTRGLDPTAPMKDSGIPWLGQVPAHWAVSRLRYVLREVDVRSVDGAGQALSMSQRHGLVPAGQVSRSMASASTVGSKVCAPGDIVMNRLKAHLGVFAVSPDAGLVSPDYTVLRPTGSNASEYFAALLRLPVIRLELRTRVRGIVEGFWRLYTDDLYDIYVPVPPVAEQRTIADYIGRETAGLDVTSQLAAPEIVLLREFRTRLTSDVVTGQLDVREIASTLPDFVEQAALDADSGEDESFDELDEVLEEAEG